MVEMILGAAIMLLGVIVGYSFSDHSSKDKDDK